MPGRCWSANGRNGAVKAGSRKGGTRGLRSPTMTSNRPKAEGGFKPGVAFTPVAPCAFKPPRGAPACRDRDTGTVSAKRQEGIGSRAGYSLVPPPPPGTNGLLHVPARQRYTGTDTSFVPPVTAGLHAKQDGQRANVYAATQGRRSWAVPRARKSLGSADLRMLDRSAAARAK